MVKRVGSVLWWQYIGLLVMNWPTAIILAIANRVGFDFGMGAAGSLTNVAMTIGLFALAVFIPLVIQSTFFLGSVFAIATKGSVAGAGMGALSRRTGIGRGAPTRGAGNSTGDYPSPTNGNSIKKSAGQENAARKKAAGRTALADGGSTTSGKRPHNRTSAPTKKQSETPQSPSGMTMTRTSRRDRNEMYDASTVEDRRRQRFEQARKGYRKTNSGTKDNS